MRWALVAGGYQRQNTQPLAVTTCRAMTSQNHFVCFHITASRQQVCLLDTLAGTCLLNGESRSRKQRLEPAFPRVSSPDLIVNFVSILSPY